MLRSAGLSLRRHLTYDFAAQHFGNCCLGYVSIFFLPLTGW